MNTKKAYTKMIQNYLDEAYMLGYRRGQKFESIEKADLEDYFREKNKERSKLKDIACFIYKIVNRSQK